MSRSASPGLSRLTRNALIEKRQRQDAPPTPREREVTVEFQVGEKVIYPKSRDRVVESIQTRPVPAANQPVTAPDSRQRLAGVVPQQNADGSASGR